MAVAAGLAIGWVRVEGGRVQQAHFADLPLLRGGEASRVKVEFLPSELNHPEGVGEPGVRLRALPLALPAAAAAAAAA